MLDETVTWGDLRAIHADAVKEGYSSSDDMLAIPGFADGFEDAPDDQLVYPEEGSK